MCRVCEIDSPVTNFSVSLDRKGGLNTRCRSCDAAYQRAQRAGRRLDPAVVAKKRERERAYYAGKKAADPAWVAKRLGGVKRWRAENPERQKIHRDTDNYRRRAGGVSTMTAAELREWRAAQEPVCYWCDDPAPSFQADHFFPLSRGGVHAAHNLVPSCGPCNQAKGCRDPYEFAQAIGRPILEMSA